MATLRRAVLKLRRGELTTFMAGALLLAAGLPAAAHPHGGGGGGSHAAVHSSGSSGGHGAPVSRGGGAGSPGIRSATQGPGGRFAVPNGNGHFVGGAFRRPSGRFFVHTFSPFFVSPFFYGGFYPFVGFNFGYPYYAPYFGWDWGWDYGATYGWGGPGYYPPPNYPGNGYSGPQGYDGEYVPERPGRGGSRQDMGSIDLDITPSDAQVYLNGQYIGVADDFDGWPQYLWLEKGTYDVVVYKEGYKTIARQVSIYPGQRESFSDHMERGESVRPEDLATKTHERRDSRIRFEDERNRNLAQQGSSGTAGDTADWQDRVRSERGGRREPPAAEERGGENSGRLHLNIEPDDASVYLDGRFVGTASELAERGLPLSLGHHKLAVVRPGHKSAEREFEVRDSNDMELQISLDSLR